MQRVGELIDFDASTPKVNVVLENSERGISVKVPWSSDDDPYAAWFLNESNTVRIPAPDTVRTAPKRVLFHDSHGDVLLIGCRARGFHSNFMGLGSGTLWARAAIMGVNKDLDFNYVHGLRTDISGLRAWVGKSSWDETFNSSTREFSFRSLNTEQTNVGDYEGIHLRFRFGRGIQHENDNDRRILTDLAWCETQTTDPKDWSQHLKLHRAIRDLLVLSRWRDESCIEATAMHKDDPVQTLDGKTHGELWRDVVIPNAQVQSAPKYWQPHLFEYNELGTSGLLKWLSIRNDFARALDPVVSSLKLRGATPNTLLAHTGPGLEALGYLLMLRDGIPANDAARKSLRLRFERILEELGDCLPFDTSAWVDSTCATYNGLKHANRQEPDEIDVLNAWRESIMVIRAWVAVELGVTQEKIKDRLSRDPQRHKYEKVQ